MKKTRKTFPIMAGKKGEAPKKVGTYTVEFTFNKEGQLIGEKQIKRIFK